ncbi:unnamed protein product, partial [Symbiodinium pilosum]
APARTVEGPQQQLRVMETAALSTGIAMTNALPAMATWSEGSEPGLTFAVFLVGLVISQARKLVENRWLN